MTRISLGGPEPDRRLRVAAEPTPGLPQRRAEIRHVLIDMAAVAEHGGPWAVDDLDYDPVAAALIVVFSEHGEPTFLPVAMDHTWGDVDAWDEILHDLTHGLWQYRRGGPQAVRAAWMRTENWRARELVRRRVLAEQHARTHPFPCVCGKRCKTPGGLTLHQRACPSAKRANPGPGT